MAATIIPRDVAYAFVQQYYEILKQQPEQGYKFYNESSTLGWEGSDGLVTPVTTLTGIKEKIMSSDFINCTVEIVTTDFQEYSGGGIIVVVSGISWNDSVKKEFHQTFFLARQDEVVYFVSNDILRFSNERELRVSSVAKDDSEQDQAAFSAPNGVADIVSDSNAVEPVSEDVKQGLDLSLVKDDEAASASKSSSPSHSDEPMVVEPVSVAKVDPKVSYASVLKVAKVTPSTSPTGEKVSPNAVKRVNPPPTNKASSTPRDVPPKVATPSNVVPESSVPVNDVPNAYSKAKKIYIGNLPRGISQKDVAEVMKKFGSLRRRSDGIQLTCYEDGFCYGVVEFESPDGARRAVEAQSVHFGDKRAYITYKRLNSRGGNGDKAEGGNKQRLQSGNQRPQSGNRNGHSNGQVRDRSRQSR